MNILILSWRGPKNPNAGGAEIASHEHAKAWVKNGHRVVLFTSLFKGGLDSEVIDGVEIIRQGNEVFGVNMRAFWWFFFGKHPKFDLVVDEIHGVPFFTPLYVKGNRLCYIHEVAKEVWKLNPWPFPFNLIPYLVGTISEPFVFRFIYKNQKFMTVSESTKRDLVGWGVKEENIHVIHNGVSTVKVNVKKEKIKTLIYLGVLTKDKGVESIIDIFNLVYGKNFDCKLWIVGKGKESYVDYLQSKVINFKRNVKFWGFVSERKKFELLRKAHVLVNPSVREGWGLVNIEANSVSTPVVGWNVAGVRDSIINHKTGILVKYGDLDSFAVACESILNDSKLYRDLSREAFKWSKKFNWEESTKKSSELLKEFSLES